MKKALIVTSTAGFARGFLLHDMYLLQKMGYEVHCASNGNNMSFDAETLFSSNGMFFHQIDFSLRSPFSKETLVSAKQFRDLINTNSFDVIHCHTPIVGAIVRIMGIPARWFRKCKILYTTHGLAFPKGCKWKDRLLYGSVEWLCGRLCDGVITINYEDYHTMKAMGCKNVYHINGVGVNTKRFHDVEMDRDAYRESLGVAKDDIMILAVGELSPRKNHQIIVKALSEIKDPHFVLLICGKEMAGTGTKHKLETLARELGVRMQLLGFRRDIPQVTHCADIAVIPSVREGLGLAGVEALASGVPVIGSAVQGIKDYVVDGKTGFLCEPFNHKDFAGRMKELADPELRERMKPFCIEKAEEFRTEVSYKQMEEIYREVLNWQG